MREIKFAVAIATMLLTTMTYAKDERSMLSLADAMNTDEMKEARDPGVRLFFGKQAYPKVEKSFGETKLSRKTTVNVQEPVQACQHAFARAMRDFQERARAAGANAAINIHSNYKNVEIASETEYMCGVGTWTAGVAFKGELVKLAE